jgi:outer membrane protein TolC
MPLDDGRIIQPLTEPGLAPLAVDEAELQGNAIQHRTELNIQRLRINLAKLQIKADQNYLRPQLDLVSRYRYRGLGDNLYDPRVPRPIPGMPDQFDSVSSNRHEWRLGLELLHPVGFRQAHTAIKNDKLRLARERAVLAAMEKQVQFEVKSAITDVQRAYSVISIAERRREAALSRYNFLKDPTVQEARPTDYNLVIDAESRLADAQSSYYRARVDYAVAIKNLYFVAGSLFGYSNVQLTGVH